MHPIGNTPTKKFSFPDFFFLRDFHYTACALARQTERDIQTESEESPPRGDGHAAIPSPPLSSRDLGHACTRARREFKPPGPGRKPWSTTWESSDIAIMLTAGPKEVYIYIYIFFFREIFTVGRVRSPDRQRET